MLSTDDDLLLDLDQTHKLPVDSASVRNCRIQPSELLISKNGTLAGSSRSIVVVVEALTSLGLIPGKARPKEDLNEFH